MKYKKHLKSNFKAMSPSMRRVWIEIDADLEKAYDYIVTLHAEGVD